MTEDFIRNRITQLRIQKGVSEYQMSYDLGHSRGYIYNISSGKSLPPLSEFLAICDYFNITPAEFFNENNAAPEQLRVISESIMRLNEEDRRLVQMIVNRLLER